MDRYKETFKTWDKVAELYEEKFMDLVIYDDTYDKLCNYLVTGSSVLDIGCGPGNITKYLLRKKPDLNIRGIDISPNMVRLAKKNCPAAQFTVADGREILRLEENFDAIVCGFCLPYLSEPELGKIIEDSSRLLNSKGIIYLSFVEGETHKSGFLTASTGDRTYFNYHKLDKVDAHLRTHDFKILDLMRIAFDREGKAEEMHTIVIARKI